MVGMPGRSGGHNRKSLAVTKLHGNAGKGRLPTEEPKPPSIVTVAPPPGLNRWAKAEFRRMVPVLRSMRVLTEADLAALVVYVVAYGALWEANSHLRRGGSVFVFNEKPMESPWVKIRDRALVNLLAVAREFGLTPVSRIRLGRPGAPPAGDATPGDGMPTISGEADELDTYLDGKPE